MATSSANNTPGGHRQKFTEEPPSELICKICDLVTRDPQQTKCCGTLYCKGCLSSFRKRTHSISCPNCNRIRVSTFFDKVSHRRVKALKVSCSSEECQWTGELEELDQHMAACTLRKYTCSHCNREGQYQHMTTVHLEQCPSLPISCPNPGCSTTIPRKDMETHRSVCLKESITCEYSKFGCSFKGTRDSIESHNAECVTEHLDLSRQRVEDLERQLDTYYRMYLPLVFKVTNFEERCKSKEGYFISPTFKSHPHGCGMFVVIIPNVNFEGQAYICVQIFAKDDQFFRGEIEIELLNQLADSNHHILKGHFVASEYKPKRIESTIFELLPHADLGHNLSINRQYLMNDCIYVKVAKVTTSDVKKPWLM